MLFGQPSIQEAITYKSILDTFSDASGTSVSASKSQIFFFNTSISTQNSIVRILGFTISHLPAKYLAAPLIDSAIKHSSWHSLLEKLEARLSSWTFCSLNLASRLILVKAVLQSMPLYLFSILAAPKWVLKQIKSLQRNFLWGSSGQNRKWALVNWTKSANRRNLEDLVFVIRITAMQSWEPKSAGSGCQHHTLHGLFSGYPSMPIIDQPKISSA